MNNEFNSDFCNVKYIPEEKMVFLAWKKFCCFEDYRTPATFALDLLRRNPESNLVVDARNGFEDEKEDAEWGFSFLLPEMAKTDCKCVVFIMNEVNEIEQEMDMWTKEFGKYFAVIRVKSYEDAVKSMKQLLLVNVTYTIRDGKREEFFQKVNDMGIVEGSKQEPGNYKYEYYFPKDSEDQLFLMEMWVSPAAQQFHVNTEHYQKLQKLKSEYVTDVHIEKYNIIKC